MCILFVCAALAVFGSWEKNIQIIKEIKNIDSFDYLINSENMCICFVCVALAVFGSWEKNIKKIKEIKNIDSFDYLNNFENICILFCFLLFFSQLPKSSKATQTKKNSFKMNPIIKRFNGFEYFDYLLTFLSAIKDW